MNELQAGVDHSLAVFPQPPVLLQPCKAALDDPAFGHDLESVQFTAPGNQHRDKFAQNFSHAFGKWFSGIAAIAQQTLDLPQTLPAAF